MQLEPRIGAIEPMHALLLTGGASRRMGRDKATLLVDGRPIGRRMVEIFTEAGIPVTVLGRQAIEGAEFFPDAEAFTGPLVAISSFAASRAFAGPVFIASCDMPRFEARLTATLLASIGEFDAAVPCLAGCRQPLCALYQPSAFDILPVVVQEGKRSMMAWLERLRVRELDESTLAAAGIDSSALAGANTQEEFSRLLGGAFSIQNVEPLRAHGGSSET